MYHPLPQRFSSRRSRMSNCPAMMHQMNRLGVARRVDDRDGLSPRGRPVAPLPRRGTDAAGAPLASWSATRPKIKLCDRQIRSPIDPVGSDGSGSYSRFGRRPTAQLNLPTPAIASSAERNWSPSGRSWRCASLPGRHRSKSLRVYVLRPPLPARSAIESCGKSVQSGLVVSLVSSSGVTRHGVGRGRAWARVCGCRAWPAVRSGRWW